MNVKPGDETGDDPKLPAPLTMDTSISIFIWPVVGAVPLFVRVMVYSSWPGWGSVAAPSMVGPGRRRGSADHQKPPRIQNERPRGALGVSGPRASQEA